MRVSALGHAGLKVETTAATILCDPWFNPEGAYQASWFPYPDNSRLVTPSLFERVTAIVITSQRPNYLDESFIRAVPLHVPVIACSPLSTIARRRIAAGGDRVVIEAAPWEPVQVTSGSDGGTRLFFVPEDSLWHRQTAVVVQADGEVLLDLGDARLAPLQLRQIRERVGGRVDLLTMLGATASWYPMCHDYSDDRRAELSYQKRLARFGYMARATKLVAPTAVVPLAGPCFLDGQLSHHNREIESGLLPDQRQAVEWLSQRGVSVATLLLPGEMWDVAERKKSVNSDALGFSFANSASYIARYAERRQPYLDAVKSRFPDPTDSLWEPFRDAFERLLSLNPYFNERIGMRVGFDITGPGGGAWSVDFRSGSRGVYRNCGACAVEFRLASRWASPLLNGELPWEEFLFSLRFRVRRSPDVYVPHLLALLFLGDADALKAIEQSETASPTVSVRSGGQIYRIPRACPHGRNDLAECGEPAGMGVIRCLGHRLEFSLANGTCLNGECPPIQAEHVGAEISAPSAFSLPSPRNHGDSANGGSSEDGKNLDASLRSIDLKTDTLPPEGLIS